jgi:hypothetical protein
MVFTVHKHLCACTGVLAVCVCVHLWVSAWAVRLSVHLTARICSLAPIPLLEEKSGQNRNGDVRRLPARKRRFCDRGGVLGRRIRIMQPRSLLGGSKSDQTGAVGQTCDPEIGRGPRDLDPNTEESPLPEEVDDMAEGTASRKRGVPSTSDGSGRKRYKCEHGRQKDRCKECGGTSICVHGRQQQQCKHCGGSAICAHGRQKHRCKECGGTSICAHGRRKDRCRECGGSRICAHGRQKYSWKRVWRQSHLRAREAEAAV